MEKSQKWESGYINFHICFKIASKLIISERKIKFLANYSLTRKKCSAMISALKIEEGMKSLAGRMENTVGLTLKGVAYAV